MSNEGNCARCDICPLKADLEKRGTWAPPVLGQLPNKANAIIVGDFPGKHEVILGMPFVGPKETELHDALDEAGVDRTEVAMTYVVACRYHADDVKGFNAKLRNKNRFRKGRKMDLLPTPEECCAPRLRAELKPYKNRILLGTAAKLMPGRPSLMDVRGGPTVLEVHDGEDIKVLPTVGVRLVAMAKMWRWVFRSDIKKAFRYFDNQLEWKEPEIVYTPSADQLQEIFDTRWHPDKKPVLAYDVETDGLDPWTARLRCLSIADEDFSVVVPFLSIDGKTKFYPPKELGRVKSILRWFFVQEGIRKYGWNSGMYDRASIEANFGVTPAPHIDGILLHRLGWPENRHNLWFAGSTMTDAPAWKSEHAATGAGSDMELWVYNARDSAVTKRVLAPMLARVRKNGHYGLYKKFDDLQSICFGMQRLGLRVDEEKRQEWEANLVDESSRHFAEIKQMAPKLNPNSPVQLSKLLFDKWGLPVQDITDAGEPSVAMPSLRKLLSNPLLDDEQRAFLNHLRFFKRADKMLGTFVRRWKPGTFDYKKNQYVCTPEGYVHPNYNVTGTVGWRFSSSNPNFQTVPYRLRDCFIAPEGKALVGADMDQLELRMMAALAGADYYLDAFENNTIDAHNLSGQFIFGDQYWKLEGAPSDPREKGTGQFKKVRDLTKTFVYAALYMADPPTIHSIITKTEDAEGNLIYLKKKLKEVAAMHRKWLGGASEFKVFWDKCIKDYRRQGYIADPVWGLKRFFENGEDKNAIVNYPVQSSGGAVVHQGMMDLVLGKEVNGRREAPPLPFNFKEGTGIINQMHDSVLFVVDEDKAEWAKEIITDTLTRRIEGIPVTFTAEAEIGKSWKET